MCTCVCLTNYHVFSFSMAYAIGNSGTVVDVVVVVNAFSVGHSRHAD